jgi:hypothetical protein
MPARKQATPPSTIKPPSVPYVDLLATSRDGQTIVAGCSSSSQLAIWTARGVTQVMAPTAPGNLAMLPGGQIVFSSPLEQTVEGEWCGASLFVGAPDGNFERRVSLKTLDNFGALSVSSDGNWVAATAKPKPFSDYEKRPQRGFKPSTGPHLLVWKLKTLMEGGPPERRVGDIVPGDFVFDPRTNDIVSWSADVLTLVPLAGAARQVPLKLGWDRGGNLSISENGLICFSDGNRVAVATLGGKRCWESANIAHDAPSPDEVRITVEHGLITPDGSKVMAAAGKPTKHWARDWAARALFPKKGMENGYVGALEARTGELESFVARKLHAQVRAIALAPSAGVVVGQDKAAEVVRWPRT